MQWLLKRLQKKRSSWCGYTGDYRRSGRCYDGCYRRSSPRDEVTPEITEEGTEATTEATDESGRNGAAVPEATEQSGGCQNGEDDPRLARTLKSVRM